MTYEEIIKKAKKDFNCDALMMEENHANERNSKIPFSSPLMNWFTYGGIPRNKLTEFFGEESSGKTTTASDLCKNAIDIFEQDYVEDLQNLQKKINEGNKSAKAEYDDLQDRGPRKVFYLDLEHSFDKAWAQTLGIDKTKIEVMQPPDIPAEQILELVKSLIESNEVGLIVLDSIPSLVPQAELDKKFGERTVASLAGLMTIFCRKIVPLLARYNTTMIMINQTRDNMDNPYDVKTPGGKAIKFYSSLRILFRKGKPVDFLGNELPQSVEDPSGYIINAIIKKQKSAPNDRKQGSYFLMCNKGIVPMFDFAQLAIKKYGFIRKAGAWFTVIDPTTGEVLEEDDKPVKINGLPKVYQYLQDNPDYYEKLTTYILNDINGESNTNEFETEFDD